MGLWDLVHGYLQVLGRRTLLFRIIHYQNIAFGVKKFEGKGVLRHSFCVDWEVRGISQEKIASCRSNKMDAEI
jgi:hypothetical protein